MYGMQYLLFIFHELYFVTLNVVMDILHVPINYHYQQSKKEGKDQKSIQSNTRPYTEHHVGM